MNLICLVILNSSINCVKCFSAILWPWIEKLKKINLSTVLVFPAGALWAVPANSVKKKKEKKREGRTSESDAWLPKGRHSQKDSERHVSS